MFKPKWHIRKAEPGDTNFIISSWANMLRRMTDYRYMRNEVFKSAHARLVEILPSMDIFVCYDPKDETTRSNIYGWIAVEGPALHMVFVRNDFRRLGIGTALFNHALSRYPQIAYSNHTKSLTDYGLIKKWRLVEYNPFLIYDRLKGVMRHVKDSEEANMQRASH